MANRKWNPWLERHRVKDLISRIDVFLIARNKDGTEKAVWISKFGLSVEWQSSVMHLDVAGWEVRYWTRQTGNVMMADGSFDPTISIRPGDKVCLNFNNFYFQFPDGQELSPLDLRLIAVH